jgi:hypothetical protein
VDALGGGGDAGAERQPGADRVTRGGCPRGADELGEFGRERVVLPWRRCPAARGGERVEQPALPHGRQADGALGEAAVEVGEDRRPLRVGERREQRVGGVVAGRGAVGGVAPDQPAEVDPHRAAAAVLGRGEERGHAAGVAHRLRLDRPPRQPRDDRVGRVRVAEQRPHHDRERLARGKPPGGAEQLRAHHDARVSPRQLREPRGEAR